MRRGNTCDHVPKKSFERGPGYRPFTTTPQCPTSAGDLEMVIGRFRLVIIAIAVVIIAGFAVLGAQIWLMNARIDQLATKVSGIDATFGVEVGRNQRKARRDLPTAAGRVQNNRSRNRSANQRDHQKHSPPCAV